MSELASESTAQTTSDATTARQQFVAAQVSALAPLDFVLVAVPRPPFEAVQVLREDDGSLAVVVAGRNVAAGAPPYTPEQLTALARLGFPAAAADEGGAEAEGAAAAPAGLRVATPPADAAAAATLVESLLDEVLGVEPGTPVDVRHGSERDAREAAQRIEHMRSCIEPVVSEMSGGAAPVQDDDGDYILDIGHVRVFVAPRALPGRPPPIIRVFAITNAGVNVGSELGLFLGRLNFSLMFGRFSIDAENASVWFDETLLGEHVTTEELRFSIEMVAATANEWDQKIAGMFGGRIRSPEPDASPPGADGAPANKPGQGGYL